MKNYLKVHKINVSFGQKGERYGHQENLRVSNPVVELSSILNFVRKLMSFKIPADASIFEDILQQKWKFFLNLKIPD